MEITRANTYEISKSGSLKTLGGLLALFHVLQFYLWSEAGNLPLKLAQQEPPMCWSILENCDFLRIFPIGLLTFFFYAYLVLMVLATLVFLLTNIIGLGYWLLMFGAWLGLILYFQDLRLSSNEGYFILLFTFAFLFIPSKNRLMRYLVASFFAAKGLAQSSPEFLTGNWYMEHLAMPVKLGEWFAALSVLVQMIGAGALVFRDGRYFWTGWLSLFFFECTHLYIGEILSASLSLGALLYVAFDEYELRKAEREYLYQSFIRPEPSFLWGGILLGIFWLAQIGTFLNFSPHSQLRAVADIWALHPEASAGDCEQRTFAIFKDRVEEIDVKPQSTQQKSMLCNVYMRFLDLKALCRNMVDKEPDFVTLSSVLSLRNYREKVTVKAFEVKDFCASSVSFKTVNEARWNTNQDK